MKSKQETLSRIARYLMLHSSFTNNLGLLNGKMGIAIFFFHYARYANKSIYEDFAGELIDEIYENIQINSPRDFKDGLSGIAWGIEYLIRNNFVEANADEVLEELDLQILERDVRRIKDSSLDTGLKGIAYYVISRCGNRKEANPFINKDYIIDLLKTLELQTLRDEENRFLTEQLINILNNENTFENKFLLHKMTSKIRFNMNTLFEEHKPLGIANKGYTGIGFNILWGEEK